jgi:hypothetical protein
MEAIHNTGFTLPMEIQGQGRELIVRKHLTTDRRYHVTAADDNGEPVEFVLIRTPVGHWITGGDMLPGWVTAHGQLIGKEIEARLHMAS